MKSKSSISHELFALYLQAFAALSVVNDPGALILCLVAAAILARTRSPRKGRKRKKPLPGKARG